MQYKFEVGQRVVVIGGPEVYVGAIAFVCDLGYNSDYPIRIEFENSEMRISSLRFKENELMLWNGITRAKRVLRGMEAQYDGYEEE